MPEVLTKIAINKLYTQDWFYIQRVLHSYIKKLESRKKGEVGRYEILKPLPTQEEFNALLTKSYTSTAEGMLEEVVSEIDSLADEIVSWKEAIEEKFSQTEKYQQLEELADALENARDSQPDWPDVLSGVEIPVVWIEPVPKIFRGQVQRSRQTRMGEACDKLQTVIDVLNDTDALLELAKADPEHGEIDEDEFTSEIENFRSELENIHGELEGLEFPAMR